MARYKVTLPSNSGETLKVSWLQRSENIPINGKSVEIEVPDGIEFVLNRGGCRQTFKADGSPKYGHEAKVFGVSSGNSLQGTPKRNTIQAEEPKSDKSDDKAKDSK